MLIWATGEGLHTIGIIDLFVSMHEIPFQETAELANRSEMRCLYAM